MLKRLERMITDPEVPLEEKFQAFNEAFAFLPAYHRARFAKILKPPGKPLVLNILDDACQEYPTTEKPPASMAKLDELKSMHQRHSDELIAEEPKVRIGGKAASIQNLFNHTCDSNVLVSGHEFCEISCLNCASLTLEKCSHITLYCLACPEGSILLQNCHDIRIEDGQAAQLRLNNCQRINICGQESLFASPIACDGCLEIECSVAPLIYFDK